MTERDVSLISDGKSAIEAENARIASLDALVALLRASLRQSEDEVDSLRKLIPSSDSIEAYACLIANTLVGNHKDEEVATVISLINELLGRK